MSSRALRKLGKKDDIFLLAGKEEQEEEIASEDEDVSSKVVRKKNKFHLLTADNDVLDATDSESENEKENNESKNDVLSNNTRNNKNPKSSNDPSIQVKRKKKKNKKKSNNKDKVDENKTNEHSEDEVEKCVREVNKMLGVTSDFNASFSEPSSVEFSCKSILGVEHRNLNADNEMRRKFGANVIGTDRRRNPHARVPTRSTWLVPQRPNWKPASKSGITMKLLENKNGYYHFTFEHTPAYQEIQFKFLDAVESLDHNNIMALLNNNPNHIDSLLQLSEVCKINEDHQMAAELIERALFIYERSFHTLFSVSKGNCRLDYRRAENRSFFLALFRHMSFLGDRACYRTALEFSKLILGLDPDDQLAMLLFIDFYAIKSEEYDYLLQIYEEWGVSKNLLQLPNFAYSIPLAMFYSRKYSNEQASSMLQDAMIKFPTALLQLMDKCSVMLSDDVMKHSYFQRTNDVKQSDGLNRLISLYIGRCHVLWKIPEILDWLENCAKAAIGRINSNDPLCTKWSQLWKSLYQRVPLNIYRHILITDVKEASRGLPPEISNRIIRMYDPLPPEDSVCGYSIPEKRQHEGSDDGLVSLFLRSLLPSYETVQQPGVQQPGVQQPGRGNAPRRAPREELQGAEAAIRPGIGNDVAQSAQRLMGAMRDLLNSMTYRGDLEEARNVNDEEQDWEEELE